MTRGGEEEKEEEGPIGSGRCCKQKVSEPRRLALSSEPAGVRASAAVAEM
jgi:hypothetical protein